ncbi:hypothetical protein LCGC14_2263960 [marine sediment metagenome]|uniref:Uncharacterized protein n=1 Tax=marine sediment metagenome TaxID=412755 RepID=A0A0F9CYU7_9ZZZZ
MEDISSLTIAELKKKIQKTEQSLKSNFVNPIDKFTKIDDLLRETVIALRSSIKEQRINNKLLLAIYYKNGENGYIQPNGIDTSAILSDLSVRDDYKTIIKNLENVKITGSERVFEIAGMGIMAECKLQSSNSTIDNKTYSIRIFSDKDLIYSGTWANFESRSYYESDLTCYEDDINGNYILSFKNIAYLKNLKIEVYESSATLTNIYLKYHEKRV